MGVGEDGGFAAEDDDEADHPNPNPYPYPYPYPYPNPNPNPDPNPDPDPNPNPNPNPNLNPNQVCLETLTCFRRAGADVILTYYAKQASKWLIEDGLL